MKFSIILHSSTQQSAGAHSALLFVETALSMGHEIYRVFFSGDGTYAASSLAVVGRHEDDIPARWQQLAATHDFEIVACISAAIKRGIISEEEAARHGKQGLNLQADIQLAGLGEYIDAVAHSDRVITFGV